MSKQIKRLLKKYHPYIFSIVENEFFFFYQTLPIYPVIFITNSLPPRSLSLTHALLLITTGGSPYGRSPTGLKVSYFSFRLFSDFIHEMQCNNNYYSWSSVVAAAREIACAYSSRVYPVKTACPRAPLSPPLPIFTILP